MAPHMNTDIFVLTIQPLPFNSNLLAHKESKRIEEHGITLLNEPNFGSVTLVGPFHFGLVY